MGYSSWGHKESDTTERLRFTPSAVAFLCCLHCGLAALHTPWLSLLLPRLRGPPGIPITSGTLAPTSLGATVQERVKVGGRALGLDSWLSLQDPGRVRARDSKPSLRTSRRGLGGGGGTGPERWSRVVSGNSQTIHGEEEPL